MLLKNFKLIWAGSITNWQENRTYADSDGSYATDNTSVSCNFASVANLPLRLGRGTTPVTENDTWLASPLTYISGADYDGSYYSTTLTTRIDSGTGRLKLIATTTFKNSRADKEGIEVTEMGLRINMDGNSSDHVSLVAREVLSTPVTILYNESKVFVMEILA